MLQETGIDANIDEPVYTSRKDQWDRFSSIRSRPRRIISSDPDEYYFPISRQSLCVHPKIIEMGDDAIRFILLQTVYKFMYEIAMLETEMVNAAACNVANNRLPFNFPDSVRQDALTVIIDEAYHAFVAIDFMKQVEQKTHVKPIDMPKYSPNTLAIQLVNANLPSDLHQSFELIAVCISEHTLTKELISVGKEGKTLKSFSEVMADHVLDEGRHAMIFSNILTMFWKGFSDFQKELIGCALPFFIKEYLNRDQQIEFDREILRQLKISTDDINKIIAETHMEYDDNDLKNINPIIPNLIDLLDRTGVLTHQPTYKSFVAAQLI